MILSISLALLIAGTLLVLLNHTEIPEIPIYIFSGILLSFLSGLIESLGIVSHGFVEDAIMRELSLLGLSILIFYSTSGTLVDSKRSTAINSFKASSWLSIISFAGTAGICLYFGFSSLEAVIFGVAASMGSTLLDSGLVKEEARKNHIFGWITEDMNFYDDMFGIMVLTVLFSSLAGLNLFKGLLTGFAVVLAALLLREYYSSFIMKITAGVNELVLLSGISTLIGFVWLTEKAGISALAGIFSAGLLITNTELGFKIRERFSAVKDFFTALSFIAIGYLLTSPGTKYIVLAVGLAAFTSVIRPLISTQFLRLQGYDLRTSFMASIQSAQISEIVVVGSLLIAPLTQNPIFETVAIGFALTTLVAHLTADREQQIFEFLFSDYELYSEKSYIPSELEDHVIIAGYDWKTRGLEKSIDRDILVIDYSLESIEVAEEKGLPHLLADLNSDATWSKARIDEASIIVSAVSDSRLLEEIEEMDTEAEKVLLDSRSEDITEKLREMLEESLD